MTDATFFDRLEDELRAAAVRPPRSRAPRAIAAAAAVLAIGGLALIPVALVGGGGQDHPATPDGSVAVLPPVGTVIPKGAGDPPRPAAAMVVASGRDRASGPWQLEVSRSGRQKLCLMLYLPSGRMPYGPSLGGYCGPGDLGFRKTPGFSRQQTNIPPTTRVRTVVVFGRAPKRADMVRLSFPKRFAFLVKAEAAPPAFKRRFGFDASFYAAVVGKVTVPGARINWVDHAGHPGSRGIPLMPPLTPR